MGGDPPTASDADPARGTRRVLRRRWGAMATVVLLLAIAGMAWVWRDRPLEVNWAVAWRGPAMDTVYASGVVDYGRQADVVAPVSAPIVSVLGVEGRRVRRGEVLARLEDAAQSAQVAQLEAQAALARGAANRARRLAEAGFGSRAANEDAQAQLRAAEAAVRSAEALAAFYTVRAPFAGVIVRRDAEPGNLATPSTALFTVAAVDTLRVTAEVDERDIEGLRIGATAWVSSDARPGRVVQARVAALTPAGDPQGRVFRVRLALPAGTDLRP